MATILLLTSLLILSLLVVHLVNRREERLRRARLHLRRFRWRIESLEEVLVGIEAILSDRRIARNINREIIHLLEQMREQEPGDKTHIDTRLTHLREREDEMLNNARQPRASRLRDSDAELARTRETLDQAARVLRRQNNEERLEGSLSEFLEQISWARLTMAVVTYIGEGHKALQRGDITTAQAYYKKAQGLLIGSDHSYPQRSDMIHQLGEMIQGKRTALSEELMPETELNPPSDHALPRRVS